jgi:hypothetical protein
MLLEDIVDKNEEWILCSAYFSASLAIFEMI